MTYFAPDEKLAQRAAAHLNLTDRAADPSRPTTSYVVERYPMPGGRYRHKDYTHEWGVVRRWKYVDRPDLGEFGGAFIMLTGRDWS